MRTPTAARRLRLRSRLAAAVLAAALAGGFPGGARSETAFFSAVADLPLMPGLTERPGDLVVFDSAEGRIVRIAAAGRLAAADVRRYYRAALPAFGWTPAGKDRYRREGEMLSLGFARGEGGLVLRFALAPEGGAGDGPR